MNIKTTGVSEDKFSKKCFKFIGKEWFRGLSYSSKNTESAGGWQQEKEETKSIDSGDVHRSFSGVFINPTVFSTWIIKIPEERNPGLDLTKLTEVEIQFSGSFVASTSKHPLCEKNEISDEEYKSMDELYGEKKSFIFLSALV